MIEQLPAGWGAAHTLTRKNLRREFWQALRSEWQGVYRYQGLPALLRCLQGTAQVLHTLPAADAAANSLDCLSCTVIPEIGCLWSYFLTRACAGQPHNLLLADSSGNLDRAAVPGAQVLRLFNFNHGTKLDVLARYACGAEFVLICDDDIFWLDCSPLDWALRQFNQDDKLAVVSFHPRPHKIPQLRDEVDEPMGSYCILVRRSIFLEQGLSFKFYKSPDWKIIGNYFDTADYANLLLVQRGFHVMMAPTELRDRLVPFYGTSMWGLKILSSRGEISGVVNPNRPDEYKKAYRTALALLGFQQLLAELGSPHKALIRSQYLGRALEVAQGNLDGEIRAEVEQDIQGKLTKMKISLQTQE